MYELKRIYGETVTGSTGNIILGINNDGLNFIVAGYCYLQQYSVRPWVTGVSDQWVITVINPNTGDTVNNTTVQYRCLWLRINHT